MIKATKHQGLAGYRFLIALAAISLFPAGRADCFAGIPSATASNSASTVIQTKKLTVTGYASTFPHCSMKSSEYLWPKTKRLVKDERRSKSKLRVCA